ncbi:ImmA/IrrE family metallo-endopeptidase [Pyxidicoccus trucidator]|uniref:ImmA/IrrE family metallo-endopeptidase n=1 Tax=Pyxidicoccus trucidator TaxID=2709662 RepID=UPI0013DAA5D8|nr:ImmA/IrrE family metallo-endopeptidase [Pyxidicoccus trucidator]
MAVEFSPKALQLAREERGLSQSALARLMDVSQGAVSQVENGVMKPGEDFVRKVTEALRYPRSFFAMPPPYRALPVLTFRKQKTLSPVTLRSIQARLAIRHAELMRLLQSVDVPETRLPAIKVRREGPTQEPTPSPEEVAQELRMRWQVPPGPVENLTELVEDVGVVVCLSHFGTPKMCGMSDFNPEELLPPVIYLNAEMPPDRHRYTVAHEVGHLVFHHHLPLPPELSLCEEEADRFASEFLMPAEEIADDLQRLNLEKLYSLKRYWKVSMAALVRRAADLEVISPERARSLYIELAKRGFKTAEPQLFEKEAPSLITEMTQFFLDELGYSEEQLSDVLKLSASELREIYLGQQRRLRVVS